MCVCVYASDYLKWPTMFKIQLLLFSYESIREEKEKENKSFRISDHTSMCTIETTVGKGE